MGRGGEETFFRPGASRQRPDGVLTGSIGQNNGKTWDSLHWETSVKCEWRVVQTHQHLMPEIPRPLKRLLRTWAEEAHEEELRQALVPLPRRSIVGSAATSLARSSAISFISSIKLPSPAFWTRTKFRPSYWNMLHGSSFTKQLE